MEALFANLNANVANIAKEYAKECLKIWIDGFLQVVKEHEIDVDQDGLFNHMVKEMPVFKFPVISEDGKVKKKRGPTAYSTFQKQTRSELKEKHPKWSEEQIRTAISEAWSEADKEEWSEKAGVEKKEKVAKKISGYNLFCREERSKVVADGFTDNKEIMKEIGARWSALTEKKKAKWNQGAKLQNEENGFSSGSSESGESKKGKKKGKKIEVEEEVEEIEEIEEIEEDDSKLKKSKKETSGKGGKRK
jgi:hypothetical protein